MDQEKLELSSRSLPRALIIGFIAVTVVFTLVGVVWTLQGFIPVFGAELPITLTVYAQVMSAFGTIILTLGLVLLYDQQTEIQRRQEEWMEAEHVPDVFVDFWELDRDQFTFSMTNLGTGIAKNVEVVYEIEPIDSNDKTKVQSIVGVAPLEQSNIFTRVLPRDSDMSSKSIEMTGEYDVRVNPIEEISCGQDGSSVNPDQILRNCLGKLAESVDEVEYNVSIRYDYIRRENEIKSVYGGRVELEEEIDFEGLLLKTDPTDTDLNIEPENLKEN